MARRDDQTIFAAWIPEYVIPFGENRGTRVKDLSLNELRRMADKSRCRLGAYYVCYRYYKRLRYEAQGLTPEMLTPEQLHPWPGPPDGKSIDGRSNIVKAKVAARKLRKSRERKKHAHTDPSDG